MRTKTQIFEHFNYINRAYNRLLLHKTGCTREIENKFSFHSFALSLHKTGCTREIENKFSFHSFALSLHKEYEQSTILKAT